MVNDIKMYGMKNQLCALKKKMNAGLSKKYGSR